MTKKPTIHLWIPELFSTKGGIQVFSGFFLQAVRNLYPNGKLSIVLKNDSEDLVRQNSDRSFNASHHQIHCSGNKPSAFRTLDFSLKLIALAIAKKPDLIIMTHLNFAPIAWLLKKLIGTKFVVIAHGVEAWDIQSSVLKRSLNAADRIFAVSEFTRDRLCREQNLSPAKMEILHNTFDANAWKIAPKPQYLLAKYGLREDQKIILTVSRLIASEQYKGYDRILEALPIIRQQIPHVHYVIVGKGNDRDRIEQIIQQNNLQNCVTLAGFIPDQELCDHYNLCDLFAMPSKREGFGIVYLEALACGKTTLGGNLDGAIDALCHGDLGLLINPDDPQAIATTIIKVFQREITNQVFYQPELLRQEVISKFGFEVFQNNIDIYLSKILE